MGVARRRDQVGNITVITDTKLKEVKIHSRLVKGQGGNHHDFVSIKDRDSKL